MRKVLVSVVAVIAFIVNPLFACDALTYEDADHDYKYRWGEAEMRAAIEGTWKVTYTHGGNRRTITFKAEQASKPKQHSGRGFMRSADACTTRTFVKSAAACIDIDKMPLKLIALGNAPALEGEFWVWDPFEDGQLRITIGGNTDFDARISRAGKVTHIIEPAGTASLLRLD